MKRAPIILATLLQLLPLVRTLPPSAVGLVSPLAIVFSWISVTAVVLGSYDAVSGASVRVSGVVKYDGASPTGAPTNFVAEPVGETLKYRITFTNPGLDVANNYFDCVPLPPGMSLNTNAGAAGYITGTPTAPGRYDVTLVAGNFSYPNAATLPATFLFYLPDTPPSITLQPRSQGVLAGGTAIFTVDADGSWPMTFQWFYEGSPLEGGNSATLTLSNLDAGQAGAYQVVLSNAFGEATSDIARLVVREPFKIDLKLEQPTLIGNTFRFIATGPIYTNFVIWRSIDFANWSPIQTNFVLDGFLEFSDPAPLPDAPAYYRASIGQ